MPALDGLRILDMTQYEAVRLLVGASCASVPASLVSRLRRCRSVSTTAASIRRSADSALCQGTSCTQALAWLGADVVKLESPAGDPGRGRDPEQDAEYYIQWNSNKRSIALDLRSEEGERAARRSFILAP